jgi:hypothetical protein
MTMFNEPYNVTMLTRSKHIRPVVGQLPPSIHHHRYRFYPRTNMLVAEHNNQKWQVRALRLEARHGDTIQGGADLLPDGEVMHYIIEVPSQLPLGQRLCFVDVAETTPLVLFSL